MTAALDPYLQAALGAVVAAALAYGAALLRKWVGVQIAAKDRQDLNDYFMSLAHRAVAAAEDNLATRKINVGSPIVASLAQEALAQGPAVLGKFGLGPDDVQKKLTAAIGALQTKMTAVAPPPVAAAPK